MEWLRAVFEHPGLMPHGYCLVWDPALIALHVTSDSIIGFSYYSIPLALAAFVMRRRDVAFGWIFWTFAAFILLCGTTHFVEVWTLWHPDYALQGAVKALTAVASVGTAIALWPILPKAIALPSGAELQRVNSELAREVLERTSAVEALARERDFSDFLFSSMSDAVATVDRDFVIRLWNRAMVEQTGRPAGDVLGRTIFEVNPSLRETVFGEAIRSAIAGHETVVEDQLVARSLSGTERWVDARYSPLRGYDGDIIGCILFARDVTERHRMEEALRQAQKMEALGQLTGGIAHDFNNFLTAVIGNLDLMGLRLRNAAPEVERLRESALQGALRAATLTRQLLAFSRRQMLSPHAIDVNTLVAGMSELLRRALGERIVTETVLADGLWPAFADANQLESALLNLTLNARDAMPGGGRLTIATANAYLDAAATRDADGVEPGHFVLVSVTDTGSGMSDEVRARAFDPFFTTKEVGKGSGLGLSQVYGFVKQSGGQVQIVSKVGEGTTVMLYLPRHSGAPAERRWTEGSSETEGLAAKSSERVLVVEDEALVREFAVDALRNLGYVVTAVADGAEALARLEEPPPFDLLLTDLGLPGLNGRQVAEVAKRRCPGIRVLYISGYGQAIAAGDELDADFLAKPFESRTLAAAVRAALDPPLNGQ